MNVWIKPGHSYILLRCPAGGTVTGSRGILALRIITERLFLTNTLAYLRSLALGIGFLVALLGILKILIRCLLFSHLCLLAGLFPYSV
jgi:hypothetical protein